MEKLLSKAIEDEARKRISKYSRESYFKHKHRRTFLKRTGKLPAGSSPTPPQSWAYEKQFDPRYCLNHARFLAKGLWKSLKNGTYAPIPSLRAQIKKNTGGFRTVDIFSAPDAAVAKVFLDNLRIRNEKMFSSSSYAYQNNKTPLDAIINLERNLTHPTMFVSQYDFAAYFDSIDHAYLHEIIDSRIPFLITSLERQILRAILVHKYVLSPHHIEQRTRGTPQGNSLSLFLANLAAHALDRELESLDGFFVRFADDSIIVNNSYENALRAADIFRKFAARSGVALNTVKSTGIRILSDTPREMAHISHFDFLGYRFTSNGIGISDKSKITIKKKCAKILYNHLLIYLKRIGKLNKARVGRGFHDWDLVTCLNELRWVIYGGLSQKQIDDILSRKSPSRHIGGIISYFALIRDGSVFRELDGWLADAVFRAYSERIKVSRRSARIKILPIGKCQLISGKWYKFSPVPQETRLPSFFLAWRAARMSWSQRGPDGIDSQGLEYAYS